MDGYEKDTYGETNAAHFDQWHDGRHDVESAISLLSGLASGGSILELGVGTGRLALPLALGGAQVTGIEISPAMLAVLRSKPGADLVQAHEGDFTDGLPDGQFSVAFAATNTLFSVADQSMQVRCVAAVAERLAPGGAFVVEAMYPMVALGGRGSSVDVIRQSVGESVLETRVHDAVAQTVATQRLHITETGVKILPAVIRYCWPSELDLMAAAAGLRLSERWGDWDRSPFTDQSRRHISVYVNDNS